MNLSLLTDNIPSTIVDVAIVFIILLSGAAGWSKGFLASVFSFVRWIACIVASIFLAQPVKDWLCAHTGIDNLVTTHVSDAISSVVKNNSLFAFVPEHFRQSLSDVTAETASRIMAPLISFLLVTVAFAIILALLLLITKLLVLILENKDKDSTIGFFNGLFGSVFGLLRGLLLISILMLVLFPFMSFLDPGSTSPLIMGINQSLLGNILYNHNPLTIILDAI